MKKLFFYLPLIFTLVTTLSCSYNEPGPPATPDTGDGGDGGGGGGGGGTGGGGGSGQETRALYLEMEMRWSNAPALPYAKILDCKTPAMPVIGQNYHCTLTIPEAELYYSDFKIRVGGLASQCPVIKFQPYYYQRSNSTTYTPPGTTDEVDCTENILERSANCYGGMAPRVVKDFPKDSGVYLLTSVAESLELSMNAEATVRWYGGADVNYHLTNDLSTVGRATAVANGSNQRVANTFVDYAVTCQDIWGELIYSLTLDISDENETNAVTGVSDQYTDWH